MGKEKLFSTEEPSWNSSNFGMEIQPPPNHQHQQLNCGSEQLPNCFYNPNWENSMDQSDPFESALSSMVSSPVAASNITGIPGGDGDGVVLRELIGRLGSICNSGEISPQSFTGGHNSTNTSCYTTPLNSPPKLNLSMMDHQIRGNLAIHGNHFPGDPGFAERAARFSCFGNRNFGGQFALNVSDEMPQRVEQPRKPVGGSPMGNSLPENQEFGDSKEESSVSEQIPAGENGMKSQSDNSNGRKRKAIPKGKEKVNPPPKATSKLGESNGKRSKSDEKEGSKEKQSKDSEKPEPPKDYIHVRARRGQATDSHSLAERVRREKISERMKFLQDLVPGCNKVTGKAVMLDEIINYVQSLQRQVEFLSMKLATVNPRVDPSMEALISKDMFQSPGSVPHNMYPFETTSPTFPYAYQPSQPQNETPFPVNPMNPTLRRNPDLQLPQSNGFGDAPSQASTFWEDDLQSFVQMGFGQIQNQAQNFHGTGQMKVEL